MPINISNLTNSASQTDRTSEQKHVKIVQTNSEGSTEQSDKATLKQDSVNLTNSAVRIKALEEQISRLPIIDTQKVEQVRNSISDGTFEFNSEKIAEKLINYEKELA
ncbi:MAG: flagellar biosynthesis anti-sigma factor FlgM [gamma proteobacterium symbiont of Bathyaustriella thionipta]|nr:flagellar biosynthesis anti-sigma factor FlgM [gamma proteobacterium symbiont of Bathyaustriella thionipta]MCU7951036.1 flagellar biosynthesis anti-sigma factor FlgM [gamma proteobacterium symbiont of Bathyaustriella thionipta]MCU7951893.1 flagellar biosynthesis anti-sigma factor FlgM [gamma proteobacterium symbiont of Bathyaustriella thionipta]MCU7957543.1 flagellar biosynthesis anti-sigma factor FlgM [gamma proteobacterium symbiont of Bathyaustriella thionipta]MCU7965956.1 flagellar biosyn